MENLTVLPLREAPGRPQVPRSVPFMGQRAPFRTKNALVGVVKTSDLAELLQANGNNAVFARRALKKW